MHRTMKLFGFTLKKKSHSQSRENGGSGSHGSRGSLHAANGSSHGFNGFDGSPGSAAMLGPPQEYQENPESRFNFTRGNHMSDAPTSSGSCHGSPRSSNGLPQANHSNSRLSSPKGVQLHELNLDLPKVGVQLPSRRSHSPEEERLDRSSMGSPRVHAAYHSSVSGRSHAPHSAHERAPFSSERAASQAFPGLATSQTQTLGRPPMRTMTIGTLGSSRATERVHVLSRQQSEPIVFAWRHDEDIFTDVFESQSVTPASQSPHTDWTDNNSRVSPVDLSEASTPQRSPKGHHHATPFSPVQELHPLPTPPPQHRNSVRPSRTAVNGQATLTPQVLPTPPASPPRGHNLHASNFPSYRETHTRGEQDAWSQPNEMPRPSSTHGFNGSGQCQELGENYVPAETRLSIEEPVRSLELHFPQRGSPLLLPQPAHVSLQRSPYLSPHTSPPRSPCLSPRQRLPHMSPPHSPTREVQRTHHRSIHQSPSKSRGQVSLTSRRSQQVSSIVTPRQQSPHHLTPCLRAHTPTLSRRSPHQSPIMSPLLRSPHQSPPHSPARGQQLEEEPPRGWQWLSADRSAPHSPSAPQPPKRWSKGQVLGKGSFGTVYEAWNLDDGSFFAVKVSDNDTIAPEVQQEVAMLSKLRHPNIVQYLGTSMEDDCLCIFLELVKMGSLQSIMKKYHHFNEILISTYTRQILKGLEYLHGRNTVHRDIKCANILVDCSGQVKLADFGLAKTMNRSLATSFKGTPFYMAPEVMKPARNNRSYGLAVDIWSLGCTVLEMAQGKPPWSELPGFAFFFKVSKGELPPIPDHLSVEAKDFILQCLRLNPEDRPTASQLLEHPFVANAPPTLEEAASVLGTPCSFHLNDQRRETPQRGHWPSTNPPAGESCHVSTNTSVLLVHASFRSSPYEDEDCNHAEHGDPRVNPAGHLANISRTQSNPALERLHVDRAHQVRPSGPPSQYVARQW